MRAVCLNPEPFLRLLALAAVAFCAALMLPVPAQAQVVVVANGSPVTEFDIAQRTKLITASTHKRPTRQQVINALIDDRIKIAKAAMYGVNVTKEQVDAAFENMAKRQGLSMKQFREVLARSGIAAEAIKSRIHAELAWSALIRGKFGPSLRVTDADIAKVLAERHETAAAEVGYVYTLYPITVVVPNGSSQLVIAAKRREAENLRSRFNSCQQGLALARALRDVAVREPISRASADLPKRTRDVLTSTPLGHLTTPEMTSLGLQMFAMCGKKQTSQESPLKTQVREQIFNKRFQEQSKLYLAQVRQQAMIEYKSQADNNEADNK